MSRTGDYSTDAHDASGASLDDPRRRRALYRAEHRGTKEMDWLLGRFAAAKLGAMSEAEFANFERLLGLPDPDLQEWIMTGGALGEREFRPLVDEIRAFHGLGA